MDEATEEKVGLEHATSTWVFVSIALIAFLYAAYFEVAARDWMFSLYILLALTFGICQVKGYKILYKGGAIVWTRFLWKTISINVSDITRVTIRSFFGDLIPIRAFRFLITIIRKSGLE